MARLAEQFERLIEKFLSGDLDRRTRILSWLTLMALALCLWGIYFFSNYEVRIKNRDSGAETVLPMRELLFKRDH